MRIFDAGWVSILVLAAIAAGCGNGKGNGTDEDGTDENVAEGADGESDATTDDGTGEGSEVPEDVPPADIDYDDAWTSDVCRVFFCQEPHVYQCGNCLDDDTDLGIDSGDTQCLGPCDNNETGFNTEIPGGNAAPCKQDCYFDQDSGDGNDDCKWNHLCDELEPLELNPCDYDLTCEDCECDAWLAAQSETCLDLCLPLVPNGCDCFGCCQLGGTGEHVFIGSPGCSLDSIASCTPCTFVPSCYNDCGRCEICLGKTELPPDCYPSDRCPPGIQACGLPGDPPCPEGFYCITGCCQPVLL
jgi:hypothetical protein